jgi:hypothetical protein
MYCTNMACGIQLLPERENVIDLEIAALMSLAKRTFLNILVENRMFLNK